MTARLERYGAESMVVPTISVEPPRSPQQIERAVKAVVAEQNVKKLEKQLERSLSLACFVQQSMLPQWTRITDRYTYTCCWTPYSGVSGDLLEWYPITPDSALFVIGDISGHGTTAALAMTAILNLRGK